MISKQKNERKGAKATATREMWTETDGGPNRGQTMGESHSGDNKYIWEDIYNNKDLKNILKDANSRIWKIIKCGKLFLPVFQT